MILQAFRTEHVPPKRACLAALDHLARPILLPREIAKYLLNPRNILQASSYHLVQERERPDFPQNLLKR